MEKIIFETEKISFKERCKKDLGNSIFAFLFFSSIPFFSFRNNSPSILFVILWILFFLFMILQIIYHKSKEFIYKIEFENEKITIFGSYFNSEWIETIEIKRTTIRIRKDVAKWGKVLGFRIEFKYRKKKITINNLYNWNVYQLHQLFKDFKKLKGEKIIIDEKFLVDDLIKRAKENGDWIN